jgi:hypothetical protein
MASQAQVRQYLAYWFQLGKKIMIHNGKAALLPQPVIQGDRYSDEFEDCWRQVTAADAGDCYLEGTSQTVTELLSPNWDVNPCARCEMPVPMPDLGVRSLDCPCSDLPFWPNTSVPQPRSPISNQAQLTQIRDRLMRLSQTRSEERSQAS